MYTALPFGLSASPYIFTKVVKVFAAFLRRPVFSCGTVFAMKGMAKSLIRSGFACLVYLDDIIIFVHCGPATKVKLRLLFAILHCFGLSVNHAKSDFYPRRVREHLGILVDL